MAGWDSTRALVEYEFTQLREEGRDEAALANFKRQFDGIENDENALHDLWQQMLALPIPTQLEHDEPSDFASIRARRADGPRAIELQLSDDELFDRMHGAWLGRCVGCALGKPVEGFMGEHNGISSKERIRKYLQAISPEEYPLRDYFPQRSPGENETGKLWCYPSTREAIAFMESDDDIRYTVVGQIVMQQHGRDFSSRDVANAWLSQLTYKMMCTAETQCYRNLVTRYEWHQSHSKDADIDWNWVATWQNPYREWIGAQIRADSFGYAAPGNFELAAEFAWRDARISHVRNGIYGEMLCAALISAAFVLDDTAQIVQAALSEIPQTSRLYREMQQVVQICAKYNDDAARFESVLNEIYALLGHYNPVHTNNNAAIVIAALLLGKDDFHAAITIAVMGGWDSDCNGATVGSIVGAKIGAKRLPEHWVGRLNDTLYSQINDYHPIAISECARRSVQIARKVLS